MVAAKELIIQHSKCIVVDPNHDALQLVAAKESIIQHSKCIVVDLDRDALRKYDTKSDSSNLFCYHREGRTSNSNHMLPSFLYQTLIMWVCPA
jgi:hypothetical protein